MRFIIGLILLAAVSCEEMLITRDMTEYLKKTVDWEVEDYETNIFRGWTVNEIDSLLGYVASEPEIKAVHKRPTLSSIDWRGSDCDHGVKTQGNCGSSWAFSVVEMLSFRCCSDGTDQGWLSVQELVSCDGISRGCEGGFIDLPMRYVQKNKGLVTDECFPYKAQDLACPNKCVDGKDWKTAHVCDCIDYEDCYGLDGMLSCLAFGPTSFGFDALLSLLYYKSGIYRCDYSQYRGGLAVIAMGFSFDPECHFYAKNSWGTSWGMKGYFMIACDTCNIRGGVTCTEF